MARILQVSYTPHNQQLQTILKVFISDEKSPIEWKGVPDFTVRGVTIRVDGKIERMTIQSDKPESEEFEIVPSN